MSIAQLWMVWFHGKTKGIPGWGQTMEGDYKTVCTAAEKVAGNTYTFTVKQTTNPKEYNPKRRHSRP